MKPDPNIIIEVDEGVYAPSDDTFLLLSAISIKEKQRVLEVGAGTGIISLHCAKNGALVMATDISESAVVNAKKNALANNLVLEIVQSNLLDGVRGPFDVIVFNPPYLSNWEGERLPDEDERQLVGGEGGWETTIRFLDAAREHISERGKIYLLVSSESSSAALEHAKKEYELRLLAEKRLFFESLAVYELTKKR